MTTPYRVAAERWFAHVIKTAEIAPGDLCDPALRAAARGARPYADGGVFRCIIDGGQSVEVLRLGPHVTIVHGPRRQTYRYRPNLSVGYHVESWLNLSPEQFSALFVSPEG